MKVGTYELIGRVSAGRDGAVWKGRDPDLDRDVAVKQLLRPTEDAARAMRAEAETMAGLDHPNIVRAYDLLDSDGDLWLVEEWVDGADLAAVSAESGRLSVAQTLGVLRGAIEGLAYAHGRGVVHGDVSANNILVSVQGVSKLADFGLAGRVGSRSRGGTTGYASPEAMAAAPLEPPMDVYSAAAVIAAVLRGGSLADPTGGGSGSGPGVPGEPGRVLATAMSANPDQRYPDAGSFLAAFDEAAQRTFGAGWWTTAGVGAAAAATTTGGMASVGAVAGAGAAGAGVTGAGMSGGAAIDTVSAARVVGNGAKVAHRAGRHIPLVVAGAVVATLVVTIAGVAVVRHAQTTSGTAAAPATAVRVDVADRSAAPTPAATSSPTSKPKPELGFNGTYTYTRVVVASSIPSIKVGQKNAGTWVVTTTCAKTCTSKIKGWKGSYAMAANGWTYKTDYKAGCVNTVTKKPTGQQVKARYQESIKVVGITKSKIAELAGPARERQLQPCKRQTGPMLDVTYKISLKFSK